jgi:hypothetical protein
VTKAVGAAFGLRGRAAAAALTALGALAGLGVPAGSAAAEPRGGTFVETLDQSEAETFEPREIPGRSRRRDSVDDTGDEAGDDRGSGSTSATRTRAKAAPMPLWVVFAEAFGALGGPVTYDRDPDAGVSAPDPQPQSHGFGLRVLRRLKLGTAYTRMQWRSFQTVDNVIEQRSQSEEVRGHEKATVTSGGPGLALGWTRSRAQGAFVLPFAGLGVEQNEVVIRRSADGSGGGDDGRQHSLLRVAYAEVGLGFQLFSVLGARGELSGATLLPLFQNASTGGSGGGVGTAARLEHRGARGFQLGLSLGFGK